MSELTGSGAEPLEAEDPRRIGSIPLAGRLGAGGMGRVYLGVREGRYVAVKQLLASVVGEDQDFLRRFGHELDNLARLPADATAPLLDSDRTATPPWFATAYIPGLTLREAVELHGGPLPARALWLLLREAASGLAAVHALDMVHRDVKPSNVMLTLDGLTLIDFGVARAAEQSRLTVTGMVVGTPAYMAPEQASGRKRLSGATDVFALGSVLAYAACGRPPFGDESGHGVLYRIVHEEPDLEPLRELEPDLAELVAACLDKDPEGRPTAAELLERARAHGPFTDPLWPEAVTGCLAERAAFAAHVREPDVPTVPLTGRRRKPSRSPRRSRLGGPGAPGHGPAGTDRAAPPDPRPARRPARRRGRGRYDPRRPAPAVHLRAAGRGRELPVRPGDGAGRPTGVDGGRQPLGYGGTRAATGPGPGTGRDGHSPAGAVGGVGGAAPGPAPVPAPAPAQAVRSPARAAPGTPEVPATQRTRAVRAVRAPPTAGRPRRPPPRRPRLLPPPAPTASATATTASASPRSSAPRTTATARTRAPGGRSRAGRTAVSSSSTSGAAAACTPTCSARRSTSATAPRTARRSCGVRGRAAASATTSAAAVSTWA